MPIRPPPGLVNSGSSVSRSSLMTARAMVSDLVICTWLSTVAVSIVISPSTDCWNSWTLRVSISRDACAVKLGGVLTT